MYRCKERFLVGGVCQENAKTSSLPVHGIGNILCDLVDRASEGSGEDAVELVLEVVERRCAVYCCTCLKAEYASFQDIIKTCIIRS